MRSEGVIILAKHSSDNLVWMREELSLNKVWRAAINLSQSHKIGQLRSESEVPVRSRVRGTNISVAGQSWGSFFTDNIRIFSSSNTCRKEWGNGGEGD